MTPSRILLQLAGWPVTVALAWWWLSLPEGKAWQLALSLLLAIVILIVAAMLLAHAFGSWRRAYRVLPWLIGAVALTGIIIWRGYHPLGALIPWIIALPGFRWAAGGPNYRAQLQHGRTYLGVLFWAVAAVLFPYLLIKWVPNVGPSFNAQATSAAVRFVLSAVLFILSWPVLGAWWMKEPEVFHAQS